MTKEMALKEIDYLINECTEEHDDSRQYAFEIARGIIQDISIEPDCFNCEWFDTKSCENCNCNFDERTSKEVIDTLKCFNSIEDMPQPDNCRTCLKLRDRNAHYYCVDIPKNADATICPIPACFQWFRNIVNASTNYKDLNYDQS